MIEDAIAELEELSLTSTPIRILNYRNNEINNLKDKRTPNKIECWVSCDPAYKKSIFDEIDTFLEMF